MVSCIPSLYTTNRTIQHKHINKNNLPILCSQSEILTSLRNVIKAIKIQSRSARYNCLMLFSAKSKHSCFIRKQRGNLNHLRMSRRKEILLLLMVALIMEKPSHLHLHIEIPPKIIDLLEENEDHEFAKSYRFVICFIILYLFFRC